MSFVKTSLGRWLEANIALPLFQDLVGVVLYQRDSLLNRGGFRKNPSPYSGLAVQSSIISTPRDLRGFEIAANRRSTSTGLPLNTVAVLGAEGGHAAADTNGALDVTLI